MVCLFLEHIHTGIIFLYDLWTPATISPSSSVQEDSWQDRGKCKNIKREIARSLVLSIFQLCYLSHKILFCAKHPFKIAFIIVYFEPSCWYLAFTYWLLFNLRTSCLFNQCLFTHNNNKNWKEKETLLWYQEDIF